MRARFTRALEDNQAAFGLALDHSHLYRLAAHFELVIESNPLLHLTSTLSPEEFAVRHVLESLTMLEFLRQDARFADVGSGGGFPAIPCLIVREDLRGTLIESKAKKADFLRTVVEECGIESRTKIVNSQFSETSCAPSDFVSCRALDRFTQHLPRLIRWSGDATLLLFGGPNLREQLLKQNLKLDERLMPMSEQRYLFIARRQLL